MLLGRKSVLGASCHVIRQPGTRIHSGIQGIPTLTILETATEKAEAVAVGKTIENLVGGMGFHSVDFGKTGESGILTDMAFSDFAVLYREFRGHLA